MKESAGDTILYGPCDITAISWFLKAKGLRLLEYNTLGLYDLGYPNYLAQAAKKECWDFVNPLAYPDESFFSCKTDLIVLSLCHVAIPGYYIRKKDGKSLFYGLSCDNNLHSVSPESKTISPDSWISIRDELTFVGIMPISDYVLSLKSFLDALATNTKVCLIMGPEIPSVFGESSPSLRVIDAQSYYRELNRKVRMAFSSRGNITFLNPANHYIKPKNKKALFFTNYPSITHYPRKTYYYMAKELRRLYGTRFKIDYGKIIKRRIRKLLSCCLAAPRRIKHFVLKNQTRPEHKSD